VGRFFETRCIYTKYVHNYALVLTSDSQHKGPSLRNWLVDNERIMAVVDFAVVGVGALSSIQHSATLSWVNTLCLKKRPTFGLL